MLKNYFKIALRNIAKHKGYAFINLSGLAVGLACFTIIMLYIHDELSYDKFHDGADRIYRVVKERSNPEISHSYVPPALMPVMLRDVPEIDNAVRFMQWNKGQLSNDDKTFYEENNLYVDSTFFKVFSSKFIEGEANSALTEPSSIVLTESAARKYFGENEALGQTLTFKNQNMTRDYQVSGVIENMPSQSHFRFDFLFSLSGFPHRDRAETSWDDEELNTHTYIKLNPKANVSEVETKIQQLVEANKTDNTFAYSLQPLAGRHGIHLSSHRSGELQANSHKLYINSLLLIAIIVIAIAGINYVNLATARSALRAKEIGVRKVVGALRSNLIRQFLVESLLMSILAGLLAISLTETTLPFFNTIMEKELSLFSNTSQQVWTLLAATVLTICFIAGMYPAFYLSAFKYTSALKIFNSSIKSKFGFRQGLVFFQFCLAALLIIGIIVIQKQVNYMQSADLGFEKEKVIVIRNSWQLDQRDRSFVVRNALKELSGVSNVAMGRDLGAEPELGAYHRVRAKDSDEAITIVNMEMDHNSIDVFGLELVEGRTFSQPSPPYTIDDIKVILNETAVKQLGLKAPVAGQTVLFDRGSMTFEIPVIGVVKDFHMSSLHEKIKPIYFTWNPETTSLAVKLAGGDIQETLTQIKNIWSRHAPGAPFDFYFLDASIEKQYRFEQNFRTIFSAMTGLSLMIACLGLFGLAAFTAQQRTKEIGIRKVLGASVANVVAMLSTDFIKLIVLANIIAWPIAYFAMNKWLGNFAYRIEINWWIFALAGCVALSIALLTVCWQAIRAALANPVESLRSE